MKPNPITLATQIERERLADDRLNRAIALDEKAARETFVDMQFVRDGRGVRVTSKSKDYVQYVTWSEGRGDRRMRCWSEWRTWRLRYMPAYREWLTAR